MSHCLAETRLDPTRVVAPAVRPGGERRRPGRIENASPELIALMRKPTRAARLKVALYDAPGFIVPVEHRRPPVTGRSLGHMAVATALCSAACIGAFHAMVAVWG